MSESWRYHLKSHCVYARTSLLDQDASLFLYFISHMFNTHIVSPLSGLCFMAVSQMCNLKTLLLEF